MYITLCLIFFFQLCFCGLYLSGRIAGNSKTCDVGASKIVKGYHKQRQVTAENVRFKKITVAGDLQLFL